VLETPVSVLFLIFWRIFTGTEFLYSDLT